MKRLTQTSIDFEEQPNCLMPEPTAIPIISTGFKDLDGLTGGMRPGELITVAGRPSLGKTSFLLNLAYHAAVDQLMPTAIFCLELESTEVAERLLTLDTFDGSDGRDRLRGARPVLRYPEGLDDEQWALLTKSYEQLSHAPIYLDHEYPLHILALADKARELVKYYGIKLLLIDYLQLLSGHFGVLRHISHVRDVMRRLKALAGELELTIVLASQLGRRIELRFDRRPKLQDLRSANAIIEHADVILLLHRVDEDYERRYTADYHKRQSQLTEMELIVAQNKHGATGSIKLMFYREIMRFLPSWTGYSAGSAQ